ncbi:hypothetical protein ACI2KL_08325 [Pseudomonas yamanorum]|uniref:hypothetical protein n=1 Tax=Pseudomonas yamanorum TaxID=515393 RepID=UPI00384A9E32
MEKLSNSNLRNFDVVNIGLRAGAIAIAVNTAMLAAADELGLTTARGGLLKLIINTFATKSNNSGGNLTGFWIEPLANTYGFQVFFHCLVGLLMAMLFVKLASRYIKNHAWSSGLMAAFITWMINAIIVLPLLSEGFAGTQNIGPVGVTYFAVAHTTFFIILSLNARHQMLSRD